MKQKTHSQCVHECTRHNQDQNARQNQNTRAESNKTTLHKSSQLPTHIFARAFANQTHRNIINDSSTSARIKIRHQNMNNQNNQDRTCINITNDSHSARTHTRHTRQQNMNNETSIVLQRSTKIKIRKQKMTFTMAHCACIRARRNQNIM